MINEKYKYSDLTSEIIRCAMNTHNFLGNGFQEIIYQRAFAIEFNHANISYARELEMPVFYRDENIGTRRVDFLVENKVLIEIKAIIQLEDVHLAQAINYLEAFKLEVGLLINFGAKKLEFKRVMKNEEQLKKGNQISYQQYKKDAP